MDRTGWTYASQGSALRGGMRHGSTRAAPRGASFTPRREALCMSQRPVGTTVLDAEADAAIDVARTSGADGSRCRRPVQYKRSILLAMRSRFHRELPERQRAATCTAPSCDHLGTWCEQPCIIVRATSHSRASNLGSSCDPPDSHMRSPGIFQRSPPHVRSLRVGRRAIDTVDTNNVLRNRCDRGRNGVQCPVPIGPVCPARRSHPGGTTRDPRRRALRSTGDDLPGTWHILPHRVGRRPTDTAHDPRPLHT
jgi:hypothetical protein